jgi:hypothetical protein
MNVESQVLEDAYALDGLVEQHSVNLLEILNRPHTIDELGAEIALLSDLIHAFKRKDDLIEQLLNGALPEHKRGQLRATLEAQHVRVGADNDEMLLLHKKSQLLMQKSAALLTKAQRQINKEAHNYSGYALEICGLCKGLGNRSDETCPACKGRGTVLARQPAIKCSRCSGNGTTSSRDKAIHYSSLCVGCSGTGWRMAKNG